VQVLCQNGCAAIVSHGDDWSNDEHKTRLTHLQQQRCVETGVFSNHSSSGESGGSFWKVNLEAATGRVHFDRQVPSRNSNCSKTLASIRARTTDIEYRSKHIEKALRVKVQLISPEINEL